MRGVSGTMEAPCHVAEPSRALRRVPILGVGFTLASFDDAVAAVAGLLDAPGPTRQLVLANAHTLNLAWENEVYRRVLTDAALVLRDGVGVELAARLQGEEPGANFVGTDFVPALLEGLARRPGGVTTYLLGARTGVAERAAAVLQRRAPGLRVVGAQSGYCDLSGAVHRIRDARPDLLLVALGNPLQETWIYDHRHALGAGVAVGVGALFDYLAGRVPRAPGWVLRLRGEWLFRLVVEPRRLWRRYVVGNPRFLWRVARARRGSIV